MNSANLVKRSIEFHHMLPRFPIHAQVGPVSINRVAIKPGQQLEVINHRQAIFQGIKPLAVRFTDGYQYHELKHANYGTWMTTHIMELAQMIPFHQHAHGNVLVGGLGLGVIAHLMAAKTKVKSITVVERDSDVIRLIRPYINPRIQIRQADIFEFVKTIQPNQYQYAFMDTWQMCNEMEWIESVVPLRRALYGKIRRVDCWQEEEMLGQVEQGLYRAAIVDAEMYRGEHLLRHYYAFRRVMEMWIPTRITKAMPQLEGFRMTLEAEAENRNNPQIKQWGQILLRQVGSELWENSFGRFWDEHPMQRFEDYVKAKKEIA
jgi:hypothetical protein